MFDKNKYKYVLLQVFLKWIAEFWILPTVYYVFYIPGRVSNFPFYPTKIKLIQFYKHCKRDL